MKVTCTTQNQDWDGIIPALLSGKFDVIFSSMNMTPARAQKVLFSDMYYATAPVWVAQASIKSDDTSPAFLKGKTVGTQSSTVFANYLDKDYKGAEVKLYPGGDEPFLDLASGRIDYVVSDILVAERMLDKNKGCCRIVKEIPRTPDIFGPGVGAAFRPGRQGPGRDVQQGDRRSRRRRLVQGAGSQVFQDRHPRQEGGRVSFAKGGARCPGSNFCSVLTAGRPCC